MKKSLLLISFICLFSCTKVTAVDENDCKPSVNEDLELAIANMYGYARYFNPNKQLSKLDWDKFLMYALRQSQCVPDNSDSMRVFLEKTFRPLIPDMQLTNESKLIINTLPKKNSDKAYFYRHYGFGSQRQFTGKVNFYSKIVYEEWNSQLPIIDSLYSYKIMDSLYLHYPIAISQQKSNFNKELKNIIEITDTIDLRISKYSLLKVLIKKEFGYMPIMHQDKSVLKANLIERWNIMKHFYPYLKEDGFFDEKMNQLLLTYLNKIDESIADEFTETNAKERFITYFYILKEFMANFNDGHLSEWGVVQGTNKKMAKQFYERHPYIGLAYVEDTIVSRFDSEGKNLSTGDTARIKRGDRLVSVNNIPIDSLLSIKLKYIASSNEEAKREQFLRDGFSTTSKDSLFRFVFESANGNYIEFDNNIANRSWGKVLKSYTAKTDFINNLGNGVYYINLSSDNVKEKTFKEFVSLHADSIKALIFELREYPMPEAADILPYLSEKPIQWGNYKIPTRYFPNQEQEVWVGDETISPKYPNLKGIPCYALINTNTVSYGESIANTLKKNRLATLVGTNSSGINGDMSNINLPVFNFIMTVGKDLDGYHSVGVSPDIYVKQTMDDYKKGKDTVFEYVKKLLE